MICHQNYPKHVGGVANTEKKAKAPKQNPVAHHKLVDLKRSCTLRQPQKKRLIQQLGRKLLQCYTRNTNPIHQPFKHDLMINCIKGLRQIQHQKTCLFTSITRHQNITRDFFLLFCFSRSLAINVNLGIGLQLLSRNKLFN